MGLDIKRLGPVAQKQIAAKLAGQAAAKRAKYGNEKAVRTMPNGLPRTFDSQREARRYDELRALYEAGAIRDLRLQVNFTLQEGYVAADGEVVRPIVYKADFRYIKDGNIIVEDVKGVRTPEYQMKKKLMQERYCITITEI